jgi:hypothetical protein
MSVRLVLLVVLAALAASCGGSSQSAEEKWANDICGNVTTWKDSVTKATDDIQSQIRSPSSASVDAIKADIKTISDATTKLSSNLKSTGAPNTQAGTQAKQQVDSFATQLDSTVQKAKNSTSSIPPGAGITSIISTLSSLGPSLQSLATSAQTALKSVQSSASALKDGFQKADNCKPYR